MKSLRFLFAVFFLPLLHSCASLSYDPLKDESSFITASSDCLAQDKHSVIQAALNHERLKSYVSGKQQTDSNILPIVLRLNDFVFEKCPYSTFGKLVHYESDETLALKQITRFIAISNVDIKSNKAEVGYESPQNATWGTIALTKINNTWSIDDPQNLSYMHSSSWKRSYMQKIFGNVRCRSGTEYAIFLNLGQSDICP